MPGTPVQIYVIHGIRRGITSDTGGLWLEVPYRVGSSEFLNAGRIVCGFARRLPIDDIEDAGNWRGAG